MTKHDWTTLFIRILGLYLIATHVATFAVTTASLAVASTQKGEAAMRAASYYMWSGPFAAAIVLLIGILLIAKAGTITAILLRKEK